MPRSESAPYDDQSASSCLGCLHLDNINNSNSIVINKIIMMFVTRLRLRYKRELVPLSSDLQSLPVTDPDARAECLPPTEVDHDFKLNLTLLITLLIKSIKIPLNNFKATATST